MATEQNSVASLLRQARGILAPVSDSASLDAELLLANILARSRTWLHTWPEKTVDDSARDRFQALVERRRQGEPLAYILGEREFWSLSLKVTAATLIPRPETEILVEQALARIPADQNLAVLDLGTGSGAIALALASERPRARIVASDTSAAALCVARENSRRLAVTNVSFFQGEGLAAVSGHQFDLIVSNPPYVAADDPCLDQGDLRFEPWQALTTGGSGLEILNRLIDDAPGCLHSGGWLILEIGYDQEEAVAHLLRQAAYQDITFYTDLQGHARAVAARYISS